MALLQGVFKPQNPQKYKGDVKNIVYRSSWELSFMSRLDGDSNVAKWSSEEVIVVYTSPIDGRRHRYFIDFYVEYKDGSVKLIEIKPHHQTIPPVAGKKKKKTVINETLTYAKNMAKWEAADKYCKKKGWTFEVLTEKHLF